MAYLGVASYIYIAGFGISETAFSLFFALTSAFSLTGPVLYMRIGPRPLGMAFAAGCAVVLISAVLLFTIARNGPVWFLLAFVPFVILSSWFRPFISDRLLSMQKHDIGAASAAMNFGFTVIGSIAMMTGSLKWGSYINGLGFTMIIFLAASMFVAAFAVRGGFLELRAREVYNDHAC
jgi:DHA1 family bicyclomycin/chloramphenicol resistance-like MFS transporter